ncbi:MAG: Asp-tRNA(Asn)/Glu-tRNA(Gln) amidotransferase subunit GatB [Patescibacteria group bacterium]
MTKNSKDAINRASKYQLVCGMEIHAELKTKSKMFCGCKNDPFGAGKPNIYTCPVCLGLPGALPVPNKKAIEWTIKLGLALNCKINLFSKFDRKHYFYPDLPKGYQISQYDLPFAYDGSIETSEGKVGITRIHLEEDTAKLVHKQIPSSKSQIPKRVSLIDFNRSGVPLIEIVTEPDIKSAKQAKEYSKKLRQIMRFLRLSDCNMQEGGMRLEANVSLANNEFQITNSKQLPNYKVELKNINSFRFLEQGINFEIKRQAEILEKGETPAQETRGYNANTGKTFVQRSKESAEDYRYFPDPDIPPIRFTEANISELKANLSELPDAVISRWEKSYNVEARYGLELTKSKNLATQIDEILAEASMQKLDCNKLASFIVNGKLKIQVNPSPEMERVSNSAKQNVIGEVLNKFISLTQTDNLDESELEKVIQEVMAENPSETERFKTGEKKLLNFFVGQVMRKLGKKVDMKQLASILNKTLTSW